MTPNTRIFLLVMLLAGCDQYADKIERQIQHCHANGYSAQYRPGHNVTCCSRLNGDDVCITAGLITKHRRETGQ